MRRTATLLVLAAYLGGCSFVRVRRYHEPPPGVNVPDCTASYTSPLVDAGITVLAAALVVYAVVTKESNGMPDPGRAALAGGGSILGVVHGASAVYGALAVGTCRDEKRRLR